MQHHIAHLISQGRSGNQPDMVTAGKVIEAMSEWQPIETAPKDETEILLYVPDMQNYPDNPRIVSAYWGTCGWTDNAAVGCQTWGHPTHWMPLPDPPAQDATNRPNLGHSIKVR